MGGSLAAAFSGPTIGYARRKETLDIALAGDLIDEGATSPEEAVKDADLVVICTPIRTIPQLLEQIRDHLKPGAIVTDVGSTKWEVQQEADRLFAETDTRFVGSHPMCGSDQVGIDSVIPHLYDGARVVVMDVDGAPIVKTFWKSLGAEVSLMGPEEHDRLVAATSHMPHMAAVAIVRAVAIGEKIDGLAELCGTGFQDTTRVANGSADVWRDIVQTNAKPVAGRLRELRNQLDDMIQLIESEEYDALASLLEESTALRNTLLKRESVPQPL